MDIDDVHAELPPVDTGYRRVVGFDASARPAASADCEGRDCVAVEIFAANPPIEPGFRR